MSSIEGFWFCKTFHEMNFLTKNFTVNRFDEKKWYFCHTIVWNFINSSTLQILREIKFWQLRELMSTWTYSSFSIYQNWFHAIFEKQENPYFLHYYSVTSFRFFHHQFLFKNYAKISWNRRIKGIFSKNGFWNLEILAISRQCSD